MIHKCHITPLLVSILVFTGFFCISADKTAYCSIRSDIRADDEIVIMPQVSKESLLSDRIGSKVQMLNSKSDKAGLQSLADSLEREITVNKPDSLILAVIYYYLGVINLLEVEYEYSILNLQRSVGIKDRLKITDHLYLNAVYNIAVAYNYLGDYIRTSDYMLKYLGKAAEKYEENSREIATAYATLIGASIGCSDYDKFNDYSRKALGILKMNRNAFSDQDLSNLYSSIGAGHFRMDDYAKARIYFEQAESVMEASNIRPDQNYITLINSLAITYGYLGMPEKAEEYFNKGIKLAIADNSILGYNLVNSYAIALGNSGNIKKGEELLQGLLEKSRDAYGPYSRFYIEVLKYYAEFLMIYKKDIRNSIRLYLECLDYLLNYNTDAGLKDQIYIGYANALIQDGQSAEALKKIQELLFYGQKTDASQSRYANPVSDSILADRRYLGILRTKYEILWDIYARSGDFEVMEAAAYTSELIISLIDKIRINISEEESRIVLGKRYRDTYILAIRDFELCYRLTGESRYLEKAFEFTEKSKVAGLLASTRELNAMQFHIPPAIAETEKSLQLEIGFYNSKISAENYKEKPDKNLMSGWNEKLLAAINARDSLVLTFERDYPGYYTLKYNSNTPKMNEIPSIVGRNNNYINYIVSDSMLYIFLINRKHKELLSFRTDTILLRKIRDFRILLSNPLLTSGGRSRFSDYQEIGYDLFRMLVEPVSKYFISNNLIISTDNILSYLPFETILCSKYTGDGIQYRTLDYLMNTYSISYTYSATFMKELMERDYRKKHDLVAFAPVYGSTINLDSILPSRQTKNNLLIDLPYARQEAEYVSEISGGTLYLNYEARESVFKDVANNYDIIHLAMHTYLSDQSPMNSAMIFSQSNDAPEDGLLHTYEVYGIPLTAQMVVLSSCNTGTGILSTGEGILSLARGFLYSGSQSVVMSMWEIEDKSGTEIIEKFYKYLKRGRSKSTALSKSRSDYLKKASQLKSHPYYWSALVVYGNNSSIYNNTGVLISVTIAVTMTGFLIFYYLRKRKYS